MEVSVRLLGHIGSLAKDGTLTIRLDGERATVSELVRELARQLGEEGREILLDPVTKDPRTSCLIVVNGREISALDGLRTRLEGGDQVVFMPIFHGG
ncbi:TPA: molybdopterin synthase sulfur carrier subunit [Candidatus Bathyarchaeota archaeon]|nr:molybdopterin synthase sulfur carrier subunit [Candidatus Bathyarchaeota archaeon]